MPAMTLQQVREKVGTGRRWIESMALAPVSWIARLLAVLAWGLIVVITTAILWWIACRVFGWPTAIRMAVADLPGIAIFIFCAAFALKART